MGKIPVWFAFLPVACAPMIAFPPADPFAFVQKSDLDSMAIQAFLEETNLFYKIDSAFKDDIYVYMLRSDLLTHFHTRSPFRVLLALGSLRDRPDCAFLREKVAPEKMAAVERELKGFFWCFDTSYTEQQYVLQDQSLARDSTNYPHDVDAHMAWHAATGSKEPLQKLVRNLATNDRSCRCLYRALASVAGEDADFRKVVLEEAAIFAHNARLDSLRAFMFPFRP